MRRRPLKIVRTDREPNMPVIDAKLREAGHDLVLPPQDASEDDPLGAARAAGLVLTCHRPITARAIGAARRFKGIVKFGVGIAAIDRGVPVVNVPEYAGETVAEGAFALMIAPAKKLQPLGRAMREDGRVRPEPRWLGGDIAGRTVGLVGFGRIARNMARMCGAGCSGEGAGLRSGQPGQEPPAREGHPLSALFERSDVILSPHLTFYNGEAMERLERETPERCLEIPERGPAPVKSDDPRLRGPVPQRDLRLLRGVFRSRRFLRRERACAGPPGGGRPLIDPFAARRDRRRQAYRLDAIQPGRRATGRPSPPPTRR